MDDNDIDFIAWEVSLITDEQIEMRLQLFLLLRYLDSNQD